MTKQNRSQPSVTSQPITVDWDNVIDGNFPDTSHAQRWQQAVTHAAETLFTDSPVQVNYDRLSKAMDFVLSGQVTLHEDGTATVKSGSHAYQILDECTCQDSQHRSRYCKHYLAVRIMREALSQFSDDTGEAKRPQVDEAADQAAQPEPPAQLQAWACAQAPSACTLKWTINGIGLVLTLRDSTDQRLFNRIGKVLPRIEEKLDAIRQQQQAAQAQAGGGNGNDNTTATAPHQPDPDDHWCHRHDAPLWKYQKGGQTWYSHRTDDGTWCRGK